MRLIMLICFLVSSLLAADIVDFHIKKGTQRGAWNDSKGELVLKVGQTLRIHNDDTIRHRLHTNGRPCSHGPNIEPGKIWDCKLTKEYNAKEHGPVYDHYVGRSARFWIKVSKEEL